MWGVEPRPHVANDVAQNYAHKHGIPEPLLTQQSPAKVDHRKVVAGDEEGAQGGAERKAECRSEHAEREVPGEMLTHKQLLVDILTLGGFSLFPSDSGKRFLAASS